MQYIIFGTIKDNRNNRHLYDFKNHIFVVIIWLKEFVCHTWPCCCLRCLQRISLSLLLLFGVEIWWILIVIARLDESSHIMTMSKSTAFSVISPQKPLNNNRSSTNILCLYSMHFDLECYFFMFVIWSRARCRFLHCMHFFRRSFVVVCVLNAPRVFGYCSKNLFSQFV